MSNIVTDILKNFPVSAITHVHTPDQTSLWFGWRVEYRSIRLDGTRWKAVTVAIDPHERLHRDPQLSRDILPVSLWADFGVETFRSKGSEGSAQTERLFT